MTHWAEAYVGRPYRKGEFDCASLVALVARDRRGIEVALPSESEWRRTPPEEVARLGLEYAQPTETPEQGDVVLMRITGRRGDVGSHLGIHAEVAGVPWVLHNLAGIGVVFCPAAHLCRMHLEIVGRYAWAL